VRRQAGSGDEADGQCDDDHRRTTGSQAGGARFNEMQRFPIDHAHTMMSTFQLAPQPEAKPEGAKQQLCNQCQYAFHHADARVRAHSKD